MSSPLLLAWVGQRVGSQTSFRLRVGCGTSPASDCLGVEGCREASCDTRPPHVSLPDHVTKQRGDTDTVCAPASTSAGTRSQCAVFTYEQLMFGEDTECFKPTDFSFLSFFEVSLL